LSRDRIPEERSPARHDDAFSTYVVPEVDYLLRAARGLTRNSADAEDLAQETMLRAYRAIDRFDGRHPRAWLLTIMRNTHINAHRRRRPELLRDPDVPERLETATDAARSDHFVDLTFDTEIERALAGLPETFRAVVDLVDIGGLSYAEAAVALGIPTGTVMSRLHRARRRIRDHLDHAGVAPRRRK
jgi:RNA polymerase sigma-70 factor (ECF subfamily)